MLRGGAFSLAVQAEPNEMRSKEHSFSFLEHEGQFVDKTQVFHYTQSEVASPVQETWIRERKRKDWGKQRREQCDVAAEPKSEFKGQGFGESLNISSVLVVLCSPGQLAGLTHTSSPHAKLPTEEHEEKMNVEALSRAELLTLLSILEGELEAQDVVIHTLRAQHRDAFIQERYGQYDLSDPFLALQRDSESVERQNTLTQHHTHQQGRAVGPNPLAVLKLMIADLEEEKRRHAQDSAQSDDFAAMLQTERGKLLQQLEVEHATVRRLEKEQSQLVSKVEESLSQQQQLSSSLTLELQKANSQAQEEAQKVCQLRTLLQEETTTLEKIRGFLKMRREGQAS
ncbi:hypothetical protein INR49_009123 [Caranx melampygus]|nr:hypothetical protein INR49_009123 [Caranx melampygus]